MQAPISVATRMTFAALPDEVWNWLTFYEEVQDRPPLYLRLLLPTPTRTEGRKSKVGDEARCFYERGHLVKRITEVEPSRCLRFEVIEQTLVVGGVKLCGGAYSLRVVDGGTELTLTTRYLSARSPRWLWKSIEAIVCHTFHRHLLRAMRRKRYELEEIVAPGCEGSWPPRPPEPPCSSAFAPGMPGDAAR